MELTITKRSLLKGLSRAHPVADRKSPMAILSNILLTVEDKNALRLAATDLYLGITTMVEADVVKKGSIALSARTFFDIVKALPDGDVKIRVGDKHDVHVECGKVKYRIPGMEGDDFPSLPHPGDVKFAKLDASLLGELIALTQYSMSSDDTRPHLAGTWFQSDDSVVRMVTTDGHRLSKAESKLKAESFSMLIPHKGIGELKRLVEDARGNKEDKPQNVEVAVSGGHAFFKRSDIMLSVKLADEQFPPYDKVIPTKQNKRVIAARSLLVEALRRISLVAADRSGGVQIELENGQLKIKSQNPEVGEGSEEIEVDYSGDSLAIGFNAKYLLDALSSLPNDEVVLELAGELDPGVVKPVGDGTDFVGVIMPMRI